MKAKGKAPATLTGLDPAQISRTLQLPEEIAAFLRNVNDRCESTALFLHEMARELEGGDFPSRMLSRSLGEHSDVLIRLSKRAESVRTGLVEGSPSNVIDLMEALRRSLAWRKGEGA
jgi:non-homologous end joining protein Ku